MCFRGRAGFRPFRVAILEAYGKQVDALYGKARCVSSFVSHALCILPFISTSPLTCRGGGRVQYLTALGVPVFCFPCNLVLCSPCCCYCSLAPDRWLQLMWLRGVFARRENRHPCFRDFGELAELLVSDCWLVPSMLRPHPQSYRPSDFFRPGFSDARCSATPSHSSVLVFDRSRLSCGGDSSCCSVHSAGRGIGRPAGSYPSLGSPPP